MVAEVKILFLIFSLRADLIEISYKKKRKLEIFSRRFIHKSFL